MSLVLPTCGARVRRATCAYTGVLRVDTAYRYMWRDIGRSDGVTVTLIGCVKSSSAQARSVSGAAVLGVLGVGFAVLEVLQVGVAVLACLKWGLQCSKCLRA